jgi:hypothetical protein
MRERTPFFAAGLRAAGFFVAAGFRVVGLAAEAVFAFDTAVLRLVPRGDVAVDVRLRAVVAFPLPDLARVAVVRPRPVVAVFDRADVEARDDEALLAVALPPLRPAAAFFAEVLPLVERRDDEPVERLLVAFFVEPPVDFLAVLLDERPRFVAAAPFLPAELFLAEVDDREPPVAFFVVEVDFLVDEERELAELFFAPPPDERDELDFFFAPVLLLEPDDEREPVDFLVVAMRIFPPRSGVL